MNKILLLFTLLILGNIPAHSQKSTLNQPKTMPYGEIDTADLKLKECDFEKNANAMVLFDREEVSDGDYYHPTQILRHTRIKIFTDHGKNEANIRLEYFGREQEEEITDVAAETINFNGKEIKYTAVDKKLIYHERTDKERRAIVFTFPDVKAGSVIEYTYKQMESSPYYWPDWDFQSDIPTRYSEVLATGVTFIHAFKHIIKGNRKLTADGLTAPNGGFIWALSNVASYKREAYMAYDAEGKPRMEFISQILTWNRLYNVIMQDEDFERQFNLKLSDQQVLIKQVSSLKNDREKIAWLFKMVKDSMKWNKKDHLQTDDGVQTAWKKKTGNSTEINLILYHFLKLAGIKAQLILICPRDRGRINDVALKFSDFKKTDVYCPVDSITNYVLDASNHYNIYDQMPYDVNGVNVFLINPDDKKFKIIALPSGSDKEVFLVKANIDASGKVAGSISVAGYNYGRSQFLESFKELGEKAYIKKIEGNHPGLKITDLKLQNLEVDSLPLTRIMNFSFTMGEPDGNYLYINPNQFTSFQENPFLSETRTANIDFGCLNNYSINGQYKLPPGYKIDVLPKSRFMEMQDRSIIFKRFVTEQDGDIIIHYVIIYHRATFSEEEYPGLYDFYKKMYEMLNEQIVLKKS